MPISGHPGQFPSFIFIKDLEGRYLLANRRAKTVLGIDVAAINGKTDYDFLPRAVADRMEAQDRAVAGSGETVQEEETFRRGKHARAYLSVKYPLRNQDGRICSIAGIWIDITRQQRAQQRAHRAVKQRDRFLATLSHELRNPLAAVENAKQLLVRTQAADSAMSRVGEVIQKQADQMARLLDDLLDVSRITRDKIELRKEVIDLRQTAQDAVLAVRSTATARRLRLKVHLPDEPLHVHGDPARKSEGGMGLGLTLVRSLVEMHGGSVHARSEGVNRGSEFTVRIPLSPEPTKKTNLKETVGENAMDTTGLKLLVVEDNDDSREMLQMLLESYGYEVVTARDGVEALTTFEVESPDVAFIDIGLPEMDGHEVARRIRSKRRENRPYLVALTGYGQPTDRQRALEAGFDGHLTKPAKVDAIRKLLEEGARRLSERGEMPR